MKSVFILFVFSFSAMASAADFRSKNSGNLTFEAVGKPAMIKIKGESSAPQSTLKVNGGIGSLESSLDLENLKTGIDLRDEHMKENYLETKKYPKAILVITSLSIPENWDVSEQEFSGVLNLHGKEQPVKGTFSMNNKKEVNADFKIKLTDFGITIPNYLGITVADSVNIKTQIQFE